MLSSKGLGKLVGGIFSPSSSLMLLTQHDFPTHKCFLYSLVLGRAGEYFQIMCVLTPFSPTSTSSKTTLIFTTLHIKSNGFFPFFWKITN
jgi:hypothetical protein